MLHLLATSAPLVADASVAARSMSDYVGTLLASLSVLGGAVAVLIFAYAGVQYATSANSPDRQLQAKLRMKQALVGLVLLLGASLLSHILVSAYHQPAVPTGANLPALSDIKPEGSGGGLVGAILHAITGVLNDLIQTAAQPFLKALNYFTTSTPLIVDNGSVFNLWLAIVGIADAAFVIIVALLGLHMMSASTIGLEEVEFGTLLPKLGLTFLLINSSVFIIDGFIAFSNALIHAVQAGFADTSVWDSLTKVVKQSGGLGLAAMLIMLAFLIFSVILLVYYVARIVTIYIGAVLSPLIFLLWIVPGFRDFSETAMKTYLTTIFVLFVHVVILLLAGSLFQGMALSNPAHTLDPLMAMIVGLATLVALIKTQGVMMNFSYASLGPRTARRLGGQFVNGVATLNSGRNFVAGKARAADRHVFHQSSSSAGFRKPTKQGGHTVVPMSALNPTISGQQAKTGETKIAPPITSKEPKSPRGGEL